MGTHPIFESDFDCLTEYKMKPLPAYLIPFSQPEWTIRNTKKDEVLYDVADCYKCHPKNCECDKYENYQLWTDESFASRLEILYKGDKNAMHPAELTKERNFQPYYVDDQQMYSEFRAQQEENEKR